MATTSLINRHDIAIACRYVHEIDGAAIKLTQEEEREAMKAAIAEYGKDAGGTN